MEKSRLTELFAEAATRVGTQVVPCGDLDQAIAYIAEKAEGTILLPAFATSTRLGLADKLRGAGCEVTTGNLRPTAAQAPAGVTGANFAMADTGTIALESTPEDIRLATTLPTRHFVLLDPRKIIADGLAAVGPMRAFHQNNPRNYIAYITGPSRTADIERVLTIGVHGPRELHILLLEGISDDVMEA